MKKSATITTKIMCTSSVLFVLCIVLSSWNSFAQPGSDSIKHWVGTWACAPYRAEGNTPPSPGLSNNTLRQVVRISIGGDTLRVKFSNITCARAVTMQSVNIAVSPDGTKSAVNASTITELKFNGNTSVTIDPKSELYSDPVAFDVTPNMRCAITIYYGQCQSGADMTFHYGSRTDSYILSGDQSTNANFNGATVAERWYTICTIDVLALKSAAAVAITGNSITDGYGLHGGLQNRWTDIFSEELLDNPATAQVAVLNLGIGATLVTGASNGAQSGVDRFEHDVLGQSGLGWIIFLYGVNDINAGVSANSIINGFNQMITDAHEKDTAIKVYGATLTPFNGNESVRRDINTWIRTDDALDGFIDLDKAVRDPQDTTNFLRIYDNDGLHPNAEGHKAMGEYIDLDLFTPSPVTVTDKEGTQAHAAKEIRTTLVNGNTALVFELPEESFVSLKVYSVLGKEVADLAGRKFSSGKHTVEFKSRNLAKGMYLYSIKAGTFSAIRKFFMFCSRKWIPTG